MTAASSKNEMPRYGGGRRRADQLPGGRHGLSREVVAESQRERLLKAMTIAAGRNGYRDAHITEVVHRAGVSRRTFYEHFEGKEECFAAAYEHAMGQLWQLTLREFEMQEEWVDALRAGLRAMLEALARRPEAARVCFVEVLAAGPAAAERRDAAMRSFLPLFADAPIAVPRAERIFDALGMGRVAELTEVLHGEIAAGRTADLPALLPDLTYLAVLPFLGPEAAGAELERTPKDGAKEAAA